MYNSAEGDSFDVRKEVNIVIYNTGDVLYIPPTEFQSYCPNKIENDVLTCSLKFGSWTHDASQLNVIDDGIKFYNDIAVLNKSWKLTSRINFKKKAYIFIILTF